MNHLEQLVSEWLQYKRYFVRVSVPVGPRKGGGFEGELDVVAFNPATEHLLHVECSLDSHAAARRNERFEKKFEKGREYIKHVFEGIKLPDSPPEQVLVMQYASGRSESFGGVRVVTVREFIHEIYEGLKGTSPSSKAVSSNLPLLRTLQLAADAAKGSLTDRRILIPRASS